MIKIYRQRIQLFFTLVMITCFSGAKAELVTNSSDQLSALLQGTESFQANFTQTIFDGNYTQTSKGALIVKKPGLFRLQTQEPDNQLIVSDGETMWFYDEDLEQVTIQTLDKRMINTPALLLSGDVSNMVKSFTIVGKHSANEKDWQFELTPKDADSLFESLRLFFINDSLAEMVLADGLGQQTKIVFNNIKLNTTISNQQFEFIPPPDVDIIRQ